MNVLSEAPIAAEAGFNTQALATLGVAAVAVWVGWKIFKNLSGNQ